MTNFEQGFGWQSRRNIHLAHEFSDATLQEYSGIPDESAVRPDPRGQYLFHTEQVADALWDAANYGIEDAQRLLGVVARTESESRMNSLIDGGAVDDYLAPPAMPVYGNQYRTPTTGQLEIESLKVEIRRLGYRIQEVAREDARFRLEIERPSRNQQNAWTSMAHVRWEDVIIED